MIAGVDLDTNRISVCLLAEDGTPDFREIGYRGKKQDAFSAAPMAYTQFLFWLSFGSHENPPPIRRVHAWWLEHPFGRGPADFKLGRVQGVLIAALTAAASMINETPVINEVGPSEWKKGNGFNGNAKKADYIPALRERVAVRLPGVTHLTEDDMDAYGIACYGQKENTRAFA